MGIKRPLPSRARRRLAALTVAIAFGLATPVQPACADGENGAAPLPTIEILEELAVDVGRELSGSLPADTAVVIVLDIQPEENVWFVEAGMTEGLAPRHVVREPGTHAALTVAVGIRSMGVAYENVRRDGLFGGRQVTRTVFMEVALSVSDRTTGEVVHRSNVTRSREDDVPVDDLARLEEPGLPWTTSRVPAEGFFSSVLEPVITIGAIAVAVILLFTVRS